MTSALAALCGVPVMMWATRMNFVVFTLTAACSLFPGWDCRSPVSCAVGVVRRGVDDLQCAPLRHNEASANIP